MWDGNSVVHSVAWSHVGALAPVYVHSQFIWTTLGFDEQADTGADHSRGIIQYKTFQSKDLHQLYKTL